MGWATFRSIFSQCQRLFLCMEGVVTSFIHDIPGSHGNPYETRYGAKAIKRTCETLTAWHSGHRVENRKSRVRTPARV
jgi:hypothetical protein